MPPNTNPFDPKTGQAIAEMINAFLKWPLPESVRSDPCCMDTKAKHRTGTNLLTVVEAMQMMQEVVCPIIADYESDRQKSLTALLKRIAELETYRDICNATIKDDEAEFDRLKAENARLNSICDNLRRGASENGARELALNDQLGRAHEEYRNLNAAYQQLSDAHSAALAAAKDTPDFSRMALNNVCVLLTIALERLGAPTDVLGAHSEGDTDAVLGFLESKSTQ